MNDRPTYEMATGEGSGSESGDGDVIERYLLRSTSGAGKASGDQGS